MTAPVQPYLFSQIGLDSGALTILGGIVHQFDEPGEYRGVVTGSGGDASVFLLTVDDSRAPFPVNVDLAAVAAGTADSACRCPADHSSEPHFVLGRRAQLVLHVPGGPGGYYVHCSPAGAEPQRPVFDSRRLSRGDLFAATVLRPGRYSVVNALGDGGEPGSMEVVYPETDGFAHKPPAPTRVACGPSGFEPSQIHLSAMQGCVFTCDTPARIRIELDEPYDPPARH
jgi:hypothetical protein